MAKKKDREDYSILVDRAVELEKAARQKDQAVKVEKDIGIDYEVEYRKQTGKDFASGEIVIQ